MKRLVPALSLLLLAACGTTPEYDTPTRKPDVAVNKPAPAKTRPAIKGGGYYKDDGPADDIPENLELTPDAEPRWEPLHKPALRPYEVFGKRYVPNTSVSPYKARGIASWYGRKFHGQKTSIGEPYDMFAMTAAHPTLALPSYVRVTHLQNGRSVVVRVIDRGPFHADRIIDLSYTAAYKLGLIQGGSGQVEVEAILPGEATAIASAQPVPPPARTLPAPPPPVVEKALPAGVYLQLGAFSNADNADNFRLHITRELDWLNEPVHLLKAGELHRLQVGPYPTRLAAETVVERIRASLGVKPSIVIR